MNAGTLAKKDLLALLLYTLVASVIFFVPLVFNHPFIVSDNLNQNFPFRYLCGQLIKEGHLPLLDIFNFSGFPLQGNFNAGCFYPATFLFVFLPPEIAWQLNVFLAYLTAACGLFFLLRHYGVSTFPSFLAGIAYSATGQMAAQIAHIDMAQANALLPFLLLATEFIGDSIFKHQGFKHGIGAIIFGSAIFGLILLTGSTRGATDATILIVLRLLFFILQNFEGGLKATVKSVFLSKTFYLTIGAFLVFFLLSLMLGSLQILIGLPTLISSERFSILNLFAQFSPNPKWFGISFLPALLGTNGDLTLAPFFGFPRLTIFEIGSYPTMLALFAFIYFLRRKSDLNGRPVINFAISLVVTGALLGFFYSVFPFSVLLKHLPIYGQERIQGRNLIISNIGYSMLLGFFLDLKLNPKIDSTKLPVFLKLSALALVVISIVELADPSIVIQTLTGNVPSFRAENALRPFIALQLIIIVLGYYLCSTRRISNRFRYKFLLICFLGFDALFYNAIVTINLSKLNPFPTTYDTTVALISHADNLNVNSKAAVWDPLLRDNYDEAKLLWPDLNIFSKLLSVQGYASLNNNTYEKLTKTHGNSTFAPTDLVNNEFNLLGVKTLYLSPDGFIASSALSNFIGYPLSDYLLPLPAGSSETLYYFGDSTKVLEINITYLRKVPSPTQFFTILPSGKRVILKNADITYGNHSVQITFNHPQYIAGIGANESFSASGLNPDGLKFKEAKTSPWQFLNGVLENPVRSSNWKFQGIKDHFAVFTNLHCLRFLTFSSTDYRFITKPVTSFDGTTIFTIKANKALYLYRSLAPISGWHVKLINLSSGKETFSQVQSYRTIEKIKIPKGTYQVKIYYDPSEVGLSMAIFFSALALSLILLIFSRLIPELKRR